MITSVLALAMAVSMQPTDTTRTTREAFTACLRTYVERSTMARMPASEFTTAYPQQCTAQQQAYREAVIRREIASRSSRADAEESATMEIDDHRTNFRERFEMALVPAGSSRTPAPAQQAAAPAAPSAVPAASTAAAPTPQPAAQQTPPASTPH